MTNAVIIGAGLPGYFSAFRLSKSGSNATLVHDLPKEKPRIFNGDVYKGIDGSMNNWGGQLFLDYEHSIFKSTSRTEVIRQILNFLTASDENIDLDIISLKHGLLIQLPKNWKPKNVFATIIAGEVRSIDLHIRELRTVDDRRIVYDSLFMCTGAQCMLEKDGMNLKFRTARLDEVFDKRLTYRNLKNLDGARVKIYKNGNFWYSEYRLLSKFHQWVSVKSIAKLAHFKNGVLELSKLSFVDLLVGMIIILKKIGEKKIMKSAMLTTSPIKFTDQKFSLQEILKNDRHLYNTALHRHVYFGDELVRVLNEFRVRGDYFRDEKIEIKSGSIGYKLLNCMMDANA